MAVACVSIYGVGQVYTDDNWVDNFPKDSPVRVAKRVIDEILIGATVMEVDIDTGRAYGINSPDLVRVMSGFEKEIVEIDGVHRFLAHQHDSVAMVGRCVHETQRV